MEHIELCSEYLPRERYELFAALSGCEALERIKNSHFDLIVLDYALPDINGIEVLKSIRKMGAQVPVVFVSAMDEPGLALTAMKEGACDYIIKTYAYYQTLRNRIEENLEACKLPRSDEK